MSDQTFNPRKKPVVSVSKEEKLQVGREKAACMLSIRCNVLDYLVANKQLSTRRIGARVLIDFRTTTFLSRQSSRTRSRLSTPTI